MGLSDPIIIATCDMPSCSDTVELGLTALAGGAYDERNVTSELERMGWRVEGTYNDTLTCETCLEEESIDTGGRG